MDLPPFAPFPPPSLRNDLVPEEWESYLGSWILLAHEINLLSSQLLGQRISREPSIVEFVVSYVTYNATQSPLNFPVNSSNSRILRKESFLLTHRLLSELRPASPRLLEWSFLADLCIVYSKSASLKALLQNIWVREDLDTRLQKSKISLIQTLDDCGKSQIPADLEDVLLRTVALLKSSFHYGQLLMLGSDFIDAISSAFEKVSVPLQKKLIAITYLSLSSLMEPSNLKLSLLLDHLYSLDSTSHGQSLCSSLCSTTPFLRKMRDGISGPEAIRAEKLMARLGHFERAQSASGKPKKAMLRKKNKGKMKDDDNENGHEATDGIHVHRLSLITQIQDLFPDLGSAFVVKLLDHYGDDIEQTTAHLLDDSLPAHLKALDQSEEIQAQPTLQDTSELAAELSPRYPSVLPSRRNVYDGDDFDRLATSPSQIHRGTKNLNGTADMMLQDRSATPNKAAILSALAAFDSDDDERDDTYDVEDVGGTVDKAIPSNGDEDADFHDNDEQALFSAYKVSPELFGRDTNTRRGKARANFKNETGMTDEAIEGWAIMIERDPRRLGRLEAKYSTFTGGQPELARTSYRESPAGSGIEESDGGEGGNDATESNRGGVRGTGRRVRRGNAATDPTDERSAQAARQKNAGKGARANHNRRNQRARKMARGGFGG
ncbi:MAG: hypothetical protein LQ342_008372 [Letrouitia transgressa]|nr:MAG: hypothetical protein LQ342_008372 [Letrouitia transgressa]